MGKRGRTSTANLEIATPKVLETVQRPDTRYDLTNEEVD